MQILPVPKSIKKTGAICAVKGLRISEMITEETGVPVNHEGYLLKISPGSAVLKSRGEPGLFYARKTLEQYLEGNRKVESVIVRDYPDLPVRSAYLLFSGMRTTFPYILSSIRRLAEMKINSLVIDYGAMFPFERYPVLREQDCFTREQVIKIERTCHENHIQVIPALTTLGHMTGFLKHARFAGLREIRNDPYQLCPLKPKAVEFVFSLIDEFLRLHPGSRYIHLGCDEGHLLGKCKACADVMKRKGEAYLLLEYLKKLVKYVQAKGKIPLFWDDMIRKYSPRELAALPRPCYFVRWGYWPGFEIQATFIEGVDYFGSSSAKGADGNAQDIPIFKHRLGNIATWARLARERRLKGIINTAWGKYFDIGVNCEAFIMAWYGFAGGAEFFWNTRSRPDQFNEIFVRHFFGADSESLVKYFTHYGDRETFYTVRSFLQQGIKEAKKNLDFLKALDILMDLENYKHCHENDIVQYQYYNRSLLMDSGVKQRIAGGIRHRREWCENIKPKLKKRLREIFGKSVVKKDIEELIRVKIDFQNPVWKRFARQ